MSSEGSISPRIALSLRVQNSWRRFDQTSDIRSQNSALRWTDQSTEACGENIGEAFEDTAQVSAEDLNWASGRWAELRGDGPLSLDMEHVDRKEHQRRFFECGRLRDCLTVSKQRYNLWNRDVQNLLSISLWNSNRRRNLRQSLTSRNINELFIDARTSSTFSCSWTSSSLFYSIRLFHPLTLPPSVLWTVRDQRTDQPTSSVLPDRTPAKTALWLLALHQSQSFISRPSMNSLPCLIIHHVQFFFHSRILWTFLCPEFELRQTKDHPLLYSATPKSARFFHIIVHLNTIHTRLL